VQEFGLLRFAGLAINLNENSNLLPIFTSNKQENQYNVKFLGYKLLNQGTN
jgi:hypothetical protein